MLTRLYVDNFRCFEEFEYTPARNELILGGNGAGKSTLFDVLLILRQLVAKGDALDDYHLLRQRTRWLDKTEITFELDATIDGDAFKYRILIDPWGEPARPRVRCETLFFEGKAIFEFHKGEVHLYNDHFENKVTYPFDWHRPALATISRRKDNLKLMRFKDWLSTLFCFRLNPFSMGSRAEGESPYPNVDLSNFAGWYRHLIQTHPIENAELMKSLSAALDDFRILRFEAAGENVSLLAAEFGSPDTKVNRFYFNELSDGQRCLIAIYTILHFVLAMGSTVLLDEPDNFLSLRETQPWLSAVEDIIETSKGQVLLISHHPEIINQWAPDSGVQMVRSGSGPVRIEKFLGDPESPLTAAELIARGWDSE